MNKEIFINIFMLVQEQVKIDNDRDHALEKAFGPDTYIMMENKLLDKLVDLLEMELNADEDTFFSFVFDKSRTKEEISEFWERYVI